MLIKNETHLAQVLMEELVGMQENLPIKSGGEAFIAEVLFGAALSELKKTANKIVRKINKTEVSAKYRFSHKSGLGCLEDGSRLFIDVYNKNSDREFMEINPFNKTFTLVDTELVTYTENHFIKLLEMNDYKELIIEKDEEDEFAL